MACFLRKNRDLSIENSLRLIERTLAPPLAFSGPVIIWPEKEFKRLTAAFVRCYNVWGHLTRCCQFDDGTRQLAEITCKDALKKHVCLDMEDLQFEVEFLTWDQASQNCFVFACHLTSALGIKVSWDPIHPDWIVSATNIDLA